MYAKLSFLSLLVGTLGLLGDIFYFQSNFNANFYKQTVKALILHHFLDFHCSSTMLGLYGV